MKIMVIDGNSILNRAFYGVRQLSNHEGMPTNAVYGFLATLFKLQDDEKPDRTVVCFDVKEKTFRHLKFDSYKATRKGMPDELAAQLPVTKQVLDAMGLTRCELAGYEADDLIGTISRRANEHGDSCVVVTGDRDSLQLVGGGTTVRLVSTKMGQTTYETYDTATFREKYGFDPIHLIDLKALMGDSSDNIPGVPGIGEKTAMQLLHDFGTVEGVYQHLDDPKIKKGVRAKLEAGEQSAKDSYWLATIDRNAPLELDVENLPAPHMDEDRALRPADPAGIQKFHQASGAERRARRAPPACGQAAADRDCRCGVCPAGRADRGRPRVRPGARNAGRALPAGRGHGQRPVCGRFCTGGLGRHPAPPVRRLGPARAARRQARRRGAASSAASSRRASDLTPASRLT